MKEYSSLVCTAAEEAGKAIMDIYEDEKNWDISYKENNSPLTIADVSAHNIIKDHLLKTGLPILSEEGKAVAYDDRKGWQRFWMVDPLDGTKEFLKKNGEFTVNIALIENGRPIYGVIYAPVLDKLFEGGENVSPVIISVKLRSTKDLKTKSPTKGKIKIVASRSHMSSETQQFIEKHKPCKLVSMGSSLKFMLIAEGEANIYPRFAPTMEWDTAAAHAILKACGANVIRTDNGKELEYNKAELINPWFIAQ